MCPKKLEQRQRVESNEKNGGEIIELGEQRLIELVEINGEYLPIEVVDDECIWAVSSKFAHPNEDISRAIAALEELDDDTDNAIDEARKESDAVCGLDGISEKEIIEPSSEEDESLLSVTDEAEELQTSFREAENELAHIDDSTTELSIEELAKIFDF